MSGVDFLSYFLLIVNFIFFIYEIYYQTSSQEENTEHVSATETRFRKED